MVKHPSGAMYASFPWLLAIGHAALRERRTTQSLRRLQWWYFTGRVRGKGHAWPLGVLRCANVYDMHGLCTVGGNDTAQVPWAPARPRRRRIKLPFVNIERDLTTPKPMWGSTCFAGLKWMLRLLRRCASAKKHFVCWLWAEYERIRDVLAMVTGMEDKLGIHSGINKSRVSMEIQTFVEAVEQEIQL